MSRFPTRAVLKAGDVAQHFSGAVWLSLLLPGAAHFRLGHTARGALALLTCAGTFFLGYAIIGVHVWHMALFQPFELIAPVLRYLPIQVLPESLNMGPLVVAALLRPADSPDLTRLIQLPHDNVILEHVGLFLTGASGMLSAFWAADAHWLAQRQPAVGPAPAWCAFLSWLLPGSGHWLQGQRDKGLLVGGCVVTVFAMGLFFSRGHGVDRLLHSAWWIGDVMFGGGTLFATFATAPLRYSESGIPPGYDVGLALCCVAGFMNLVVMIDAYTIAEERSLAVAEGSPA